MSKEKDAAEKILEDYNDVFADIVNNFLFDGREVVREEDLENAAPFSQLKLSDGLHEQERDTIKFWKRGTVVIAAFGGENQSRSDPSMPLRLFSYDGAVYKGEVSRYQSEQRQKLPVSPFYPVITLVLYFGNHHWTGPRTLRDCFRDLPPELEPFIPHYPIRVVEVAFLPPEAVGHLRSDFRFVADYLVQTRLTDRYIPPEDPIVHVDETLKLLGAITGDTSFQDAVNALDAEGKERTAMCDVVRRIREEGRQEGRQETRRKYEAIIADKDRTLADKDRTLADKDRTLADKDRALSDMNRVLSDKDRALSDMAQELRELKARFGLA